MKTITFTLDPGALYQKVADNPCKYGYGAKVPVTADTSDVKVVDCSGFARWLIARGTNQKVIIPDGSQNQWAWVKAQGFKPTTMANAKLKDNVIRIGFLAASDGHGGVGHVVLARNGVTMESRGGFGVSSQNVGKSSYHKLMHWFVLSE